jgi:hypothetical protein
MHEMLTVYAEAFADNSKAKLGECFMAYIRIFWLVKCLKAYTRITLALGLQWGSDCS